MSVSIFRFRRYKQAKKRKEERIKKIKAMKNRGYSNVEISNVMGIPESGVRNILRKN